MGAGEAITFGEGVALPTRIKFDLLPANELPRSNTASFTKNWAKDLPDDTFLHEVVSRWRAQTYNPDSAGYSLEESAAPTEAAPQQSLAAQQAAASQAARPSLRRESFINPINPVAPSQPAAAGFSRMSAAPAPAAPAPAAAAPVAEQPAQQPSLASLIKQFRS
jgi:uncharacterized protein